MGTAERRSAIMKILCRRRHETIQNLAFELGVSERTIRRDIDALSYSEPIYTRTGRYGGGVYVVEGYTIDRMYMSEREIEVLRKLCSTAEQQVLCVLTVNELSLLKKIIQNYTKPTYTVEVSK